MTTKRFFTLFISLIGLCSADSLYAEDDLTFYVVDYPPYLMAENETSEVTGVDIDVTRAAFATQGISVQFKLMPWKRILKSMEQGLIAGTISCSIRPDREGFMLFSDSISAVRRVVVSASELNANNIHTLQDLSNYSVVSVEGWGMQKQLDRLKIEHQTAPDLASAIKAVRYRDIELLYVAEYPALFYIKQLGIEQDLKVTPITNEAVLPLHVCISKYYPNADNILATMNEGLLRIKESGQYEQIRSNYLQLN